MNKKLLICSVLIINRLLFAVCSALSESLLASASASEDKLKSADEYMKAKNYIKAKRLYREVFLSAQKKGYLAEGALFGIIKSNYYLRNYHEANHNIRRFLSLYPESDITKEIFLYSGYVALRLQRINDAQQYFETAKESFKERATVGLAEVFLKLGDIVRSESLLRAMDRDVLKTNPRAIYVLAMIYSSRGMTREAVNTIDKIPDVVLKEQNIRTDKAQILFDAQYFKEAKVVCEDIINNSISIVARHKAKNILSQIYKIQGKIDDALNLSLEILPYKSGDDFKLRIVALYDKKGDIKNAMRFLTFVNNEEIRSSEIEKRLKGIFDLKDFRGTEFIMDPIN